MAFAADTLHQSQISTIEQALNTPLPPPSAEEREWLGDEPWQFGDGVNFKGGRGRVAIVVVSDSWGTGKPNCRARQKRRLA